MRGRDAIATVMVLIALVLAYTIVTSIAPAPSSSVPPSQAPVTEPAQSPQAPSTIAPTPSASFVPTPIMTDALAIAVSEAQAYGLNVAPVEMHIVSGRLGEFHIAHSTLVDDSMLVYIVWLTTPEFVLYIGPGVRVTNVYIVVRTDTGEPFQITGRTGPWGELASLPWARVTTADIGRFPVPNPVYHSDEALGATRTPTPPASVSPSPSATQDYGVPTLPPPTPWPSLPTATVAAVP